MKKATGISISEEYIRIAEIEVKQNAIKIISIKEIPFDSITEFTDKKSHLIKDCLNIVKSNKISRSAFVSPPDTQIVVKDKTIPAIPKSEIFELIEAEIKDYAIFNHENVSLGFTILKKEKNKSKIIWAGIKENDLMNIIMSLKHCGIKTRGVVPANFATAKFITTFYKMEEPYLIISVDNSVTTMSFVRNNKVRFAYTHDTGTNELFKENNISVHNSWSGNIATTITYVSRNRNFQIKNIFLLSQNTGIEKLLAILSQRVAYPIIIPKVDIKNIAIQDEELYLRIQSDGGNEFIRAIGTALFHINKGSDPLLCDISKHVLVEKKSMKAKIAVTLLLLITVNGAGIYFYPYINNTVNNLQANLNNMQLHIKKAEIAAQNSAKIKNELSKVEGILDQYSSIEKSIKNSAIKSTVLSELKRKLPQGVYISSLSITGDGKIAISGTADKYSKVFDFEKNLSESEIIEKPVIIQITNEQIVTFSMSASVKGAQNESK